jgi:hypothetical protein
MVNYQNGKIYRIYVEYYDDEKQIQELNYIGATTVSLAQRYGKHLNNYNRWINEGKPEDKVRHTSVYLFEKGEPQIELICPFPCNNKEELDKKENEYIRQYNCVNRRIAGRTSKEYYEENKERLAELEKEYRKNNKDKIAEYQKKYQTDNREQIAEREKEYRKDNKEKIIKRKNENITCECGKVIKKGVIVRHKRSKIHNDRMAIISSSSSI